MNHEPACGYTTETQGPGFYDHLDPEPNVIIDPCGHCDHTDPDEKSFKRSLTMWHFLWKVRGILARKSLYTSYPTRLRNVNVQRAKRICLAIEHELQKAKNKTQIRQNKRKRTDHKDDQNASPRDSVVVDTQNKSKPDIKLIQRLHEGYIQLQTRWPDHIPILRTSPKLREILEQSTERKLGDIWDGDLQSISSDEVGTMTCAQLKAVIRFFQARKVQKGLNLGGRKSDLQQKVRDLLQRYSGLID